MNRDKKDRLLPGRILSFFFAVLLILIFSFVTCAEESVQITGFSDGIITFTVEDLKDLPSITMDVVSVNSSGYEKKFSVTGPTFSDLLNKFGKSQASLQGIRLIAGDGYSIEVPAEVLKNREIILAYQIDGRPLDDKTKPLRIIIPEERAMYWARNVVKIQISGVIEEVVTRKVNFLETITQVVEGVDYTYYESIDKAIQIETLFDFLGLKDSNGSIFIQAVDGLKKNESKDIFVKGYIKITGKDVPLFLSPDIPKGMYVKHIQLFNYGDNLVLSLAKGFEGLEKITVDGMEGISMAALFEVTSLIMAENYRLIAADGYTVELSYDNMLKGIIYLDNRGRVRTYFPGLPKNTKVKGLLSIEALD